MNSTGVIEVDLFPEDVNDPEHPMASSFKDLLEDVALQYDCRLTYFEVQSGTVAFSFDSDELMAEIVKILQAHEHRKT